MANIEAFQKIMEIREKEKNKVQQAYKQSIDYFEETASNLYELLKEKENAELNYQKKLKKAMNINSLRNGHIYIENLRKKINDSQVIVHSARSDMDLKQLRLTEAHMEVKKLSKMIENKKAEQAEKVKQEETKLMDELSVRQFMFSGNR